MLSKYTAVFLVPSTLLFLILDGRYRQWLMRKEPYLALLIAAAFFTPVILWNAEHDWASFGFQVGDRLSRDSKSPFESVGEFLLLQFAVTSPALLAGLLMISAAPLSLSLHPRRSKWRFAWLFSLPFLGFLLLFSAHSRIKANWTLPAYLALLIAAYPSYRYLRFYSGPRMKLVARYFLVAWLCSLPVLYSIAVYHFTITIPGFPVFRFTTGWQELSAIVEREARALELEGGKKVFLLGLDTHYVAAALSFYTADEREVFSRNLVGKPALAFEYWKPKVDLAGFNALAVDVNPPRVESLEKYFARVDNDVQRIPVMKGKRILYYFYLVKCFDYVGQGAVIHGDDWRRSRFDHEVSPPR